VPTAANKIKERREALIVETWAERENNHSLGDVLNGRKGATKDTASYIHEYKSINCGIWRQILEIPKGDGTSHLKVDEVVPAGHMVIINFAGQWTGSDAKN